MKKRIRDIVIAVVVLAIICVVFWNIECSKVPWEKSNVPYVLNADTQKCTLIIPKASKSWQRKTSKPIPI